MLQTIIRKDFGAGGGTESNSYALGDCNGLVVVSDVQPAATDYLTVVLKSSKHAQDVLVNRIPMLALAAIADVEGGANHALQARLNALVVATGEPADLDYSMFAFVVPLGYLMLRANDSALEVTIESAQAGASKWSVAAYHDAATVDHYFKWIQSRVLTDKGADVAAVYAWNSTTTEARAPFDRDVSAQISSQFGSTLCNFADASGYTAAKGFIEAQGPNRIAKLFEAADGLHGTVQWNLTGTDAGDFYIITKQVVRKSARVSRGVISSLARVEHQLSGKTPEQVQALKRSGVIPGGVEMVQAVRSQLNVPTVDEI